MKYHATATDGVRCLSTSCDASRGRGSTTETSTSPSWRRPRSSLWARRRTDHHRTAHGGVCDSGVVVGAPHPHGLETDITCAGLDAAGEGLLRKGLCTGDEWRKFCCACMPCMGCSRRTDEGIRRRVVSTMLAGKVSVCVLCTRSVYGSSNEHSAEKKSHLDPLGHE